MAQTGCRTKGKGSNTYKIGNIYQDCKITCVQGKHTLMLKSMGNINKLKENEKVDRFNCIMKGKSLDEIEVG